MTKMISGGVAAAICAFAVSAAPASAADMTLRVNNFLPNGHVINVDGWRWWAKGVEAKTEGRVKVIFSTKGLGSLARAYDIVRDGIGDVSWGVQGYTPNRFISAEMIELPFLGPNATALSVAYWRVYKKYFEKAGEYRDVHLLAVHTHGPGDVVTSHKPLTKMEDLRGQKIRILNKTTGQILGIYGGSPVREGMPKLGQLLAKGVVDGSFATIDGVHSFKLGGYIHNLLTFKNGIYNSSFFWAMNKKKWNAISKKDQAAIDSVSGEAFARQLGHVWDASQAAGVKMMSTNGTKITRVEGAQLAAVKKKLGFLEAQWIKRAKTKGIDGAAAIAELRSIAANYKE